MVKIKKPNYIYTVGKRKTSSARVRLYRGKGETTINEKPIDKYFNGIAYKNIWSKPLKVVDSLDDYYATIRVSGGGVKGQLDAIVHGLAKALTKINKDEFRPLLKKAGLLTRDPRERERRKVNTGGKARRKKQSPKR